MIAARLMYERAESEYFTAKRKAAKQLGLDPRGHPGDLPSNREIREQIDVLARMHEGEGRTRNLRTMRLDALRIMRKLGRFHPRLIGSVLTGHIRKGSDIDVHVFSGSTGAVSTALDDLGLDYEVEHKKVIKHSEARVFTHIHVRDRFTIELTLYPMDKLSYVFKSSITGRPIEKASTAQLEALLRREYAGIDLDVEVERLEDAMDPFELYRLLLAPLEGVKQNPKYHPEGDALYHSLQVFELARDERPYDEEFLLAALLHDVGKGIDAADHVGAGVAALEDAVTARTMWLIEHHMEALELAEGRLGHRAAQRLRASEDFEDLMLLRRCDSAGRRGGVQTCTVDEALGYIRGVAGEAYLDEW
jgi:predicted nucleotidyltransferase